MPITYTDNVTQVGENFTELQQATTQLEGILGTSLDSVNAEWDRVQDDKGRTFFVLRLADWAGEVSYRFTPAELRSSLDTELSLLSLWGDLLQVRNERQLRELQLAGRPEE